METSYVRTCKFVPGRSRNMRTLPQSGFPAELALSSRKSCHVTSLQTRASGSRRRQSLNAPLPSHVYPRSHGRKRLPRNSILTTCQPDSTTSSTSPPAESEPSTSDRSHPHHSTPLRSDPSATFSADPVDHPRSAQGSNPAPPHPQQPPLIAGEVGLQHSSCPPVLATCPWQSELRTF